MVASVERSRELAARIAGAAHSLRLYGAKAEAWTRVVNSLCERITSEFDGGGGGEVTLGLIGDSIAVGGVPLHAPPDSVVRFIEQLRERDIEIISFAPGLVASELEALISFLTADAEDVVGVHAEQWLTERGVRHVKIKHLTLGSTGRQGKAASFLDVVQRGADALTAEFSKVMSKGVVSAGLVGELAKELTDLVLDAETPMSALLAMRDRQDYSVVHSVNVGLVAGSQAAALGMSDEEVRQISQAGLLHDIGKTRVPEAILQKTTALTDTERSILARHTVEGAKILMESGGLDSIIPIVAFAHHQRYGPDTLIATELVRIADLFDGLRTLRPVEDKISTRGAAAYMVLHAGGTTNIYLLERFAAACGLFAPGDVAQLTSGELVRVVLLNTDLALHPTVEVLERGHNGQIKEGMVFDLASPPAGIENTFVVPKVPAHLEDVRPAMVEALG